VATKKRTPAIVFDEPDFLGNQVKLYRQTWDVHILDPGGHPQMAGYENMVLQTLQDPYEIRPSVTHNTRLAFISEPNTGPHPHGIRVIVNYNDLTFEFGRSNGIVMTAYPIDPVYNAPNLGAPTYKKKK
jgi:hypothetical protein